MAPGRARRILVRGMIVFENFRRHILILRSRGQRTAAEGLGRRRCRVAMPSQDKCARGIISIRGFRELPIQEQVRIYHPTTASRSRSPNTFDPYKGWYSVMCDAQFNVSR